MSEDSLKSIMDRLASPASLMIVSDLDLTMIDHYEPENLALLRFNALWEANYRQNSLLVYSTGRSLLTYIKLRKQKPMITPDIMVFSVGTEIAYGDSMVADNDWFEYLNHKWDRDIVVEETNKFSDLTPQPKTDQRPHKVSFDIPKDKAPSVIKALSARLEERKLDAKIIYSGGIALDVLPKRAGKGEALSYLLKKFKNQANLPYNTLVCGDSGNDAELFTVPDVYGCMVSNAQEELLEWYAENAKDNPNIIHAAERCAAGIIQAIDHFNLGPFISPRDDVSILSEYKTENFDPAYQVVKFYLFVEKWRRSEIENSEIIWAKFKAVCCPSSVFVHPSGVEESLCECINSLRSNYGDKQGKPFRIWVDQVLPVQNGSDSWLVKFKKWEQNGEEQQCCITTVLLSSMNGEGLTWMHVHQAWLVGTEMNDNANWLI